MVTDSQIESGQLKADLKERVMYTLLRRHRHQTKKSNLRSLADIGKSVSSASRLFSSQESGTRPAAKSWVSGEGGGGHLSYRFLPPSVSSSH